MFLILTTIVKFLKVIKIQPIVIISENDIYDKHLTITINNKKRFKNNFNKAKNNAENLSHSNKQFNKNGQRNNNSQLQKKLIKARL